MAEGDQSEQTASRGGAGERCRSQGWPSQRGPLPETEWTIVIAWRAVQTAFDRGLHRLTAHILPVSACHPLETTSMRSGPFSLFALARAATPRAGPRAAHALVAEHIPAPATRLLHTPRAAAATRPSPFLSRPRLHFAAVRFESSTASPTSTTAPESRLDRDQVPSYELTFTCNVCKTRSSHRLSKQGYHHGTVLIACPDCKNRHLISDHLKVRCCPPLSVRGEYLWYLTQEQVFADKSITIEDLMRDKGHLVKKGSLGADGDIEFWDDGSSTPRSAHFHPDSKPKGENRFTDRPASPRESQD